MTITTCSLQALYRNWYDKAIDYAFDFFEDPLYGEVNQKDILSKLLLDPKTWLIVTAYLIYQLQRFIHLIADNKSFALSTNVTEAQLLLDTYVSKEAFCLGTNVNNAENPPIKYEPSMNYLRSKEQLEVFFPAYSSYIMGGWAFLRIFRKLLLIHLVNEHKPWRKTIIPCFLKGFRYFLKKLPYLLIGHKAWGNMPSSQPSFC